MQYITHHAYDFGAATINALEAVPVGRACADVHLQLICVLHHGKLSPVLALGLGWRESLDGA